MTDTFVAAAFKSVTDDLRHEGLHGYCLCYRDGDRRRWRDQDPRQSKKKIHIAPPAPGRPAPVQLQ